MKYMFVFEVPCQISAVAETEEEARQIVADTTRKMEVDVPYGQYGDCDIYIPPGSMDDEPEAIESYPFYDHDGDNP